MAKDATRVRPGGRAGGRMKKRPSARAQAGVYNEIAAALAACGRAGDRPGTQTRTRVTVAAAMGALAATIAAPYPAIANMPCPLCSGRQRAVDHDLPRHLMVQHRQVLPPCCRRAYQSWTAVTRQDRALERHLAHLPEPLARHLTRGILLAAAGITQ